MKNTSILLNDASATKLLDILNSVPEKERDPVWRQLHNDVKRTVDIWRNIDQRAQHAKAIQAHAKKVLQSGS